MSPTILLADDHSLIRKGLKLTIQFDLGFSDIHEAATCGELMMELSKKHYTHLVLDIIFPDGSSLEVIPAIRRNNPDLQIVIFSMQPENIYAKAFSQYGISNYISKSLDETQITKLLKDFLHNEKPSETIPEVVTYNPFTSLSAHELEILHYLLRGADPEEISGLLNLQENVVTNIKTSIYEKTNSGSIRELIQLASQYNVNF